MKRLLLLFSVATFLFSCNSADYTKFVNPFIGTGGHGHTFPGATVPFGMVQLSPDTRLEGWDGCSGYHYSDSIIYGFSHTHLSGTGVSDYGDILFMPMTDKYSFSNGKENNFTEGYFSAFDKSTEIASPGYYSVFLENPKITVELSATERCGIQKYTYAKAENAYIIIDLEHRDKVVYSSLKIISDTEIEGVRESDAWAKHQYVYFVAKFSKPFKNYIIQQNDTIVKDKDFVKGENLKIALDFGKFDINDKVIVKVGISAVSTDGARKNLDAEIPKWNFNNVLKQAQKKWNNELGKIIVEGDNEKKKIFYTALYHSLIAPNLFIDVDGKYRGTDLKIHTADNFTNYTVFSLWDTYRATHPLYTIIEQEKTLDFIKTFLHQYKFGGQLPVWELAGNYTGCMIGYHSVSVIADAFVKGIDDFDTELAFEAMKNSAMKDNLGLKGYKLYGFIPAEEESESVSKTLEYAYDDWCIAQMAKKLNKIDDYKYFIDRAQNYRNIYDPSTGFMRAKFHGIWKTPFNPAEVDFNFTEANSWQYSFYVPQDISGLANLLGGFDKFDLKLDELFSTSSDLAGRQQSDITGLIGQYAHGNEPSHHMAYLYSFAGNAWKTQQKVNQIMTTMYSNSPDGLIGNEDCGQMSSWYVLSAMGFYQVTPGSKDFIFGTPSFNKATINLESGKKFRILTDNLSDKNIYIQSVKLNGKDYKKSYISYDELIAGGELVFVMGANPNKEFGKAENNRPISVINDSQTLPVPFNNANNRIFTDSITLALFSTVLDAKIYFSINDENNYTLYNMPFTISETSKISYYSEKEGFEKSKTVQISLYRFPTGRKIDLLNKPHKSYIGSGDSALIDGIFGKDDFRLGDWQGFYGVDLNATIDLGANKRVSEFSADFIQDVNSWIFMPKYVEYYYSRDNKKFKLLGKVENNVAEDNWEVVRNDFLLKTGKVNARYIKVVAKSGIYCPNWHKGHGNKLFIFIDEITIK